MKTIQPKITLLFVISLAIWLSACLPFTPKTDTSWPGEAETLAAQTLEVRFAKSTKSARQTMEAQATASYYPPTITRAPTMVMTPTSTPILPSATPIPPSATASPTSAPCNRAELVAELNVPAGSDIPANGRFTKIWRIRNTGSCTWSTSYALIYNSGSKFYIRDAIGFPTSVAPDQTVDLALDFRAPNVIGQFRSYWALRDAYGQTFDLDSEDQKTLVVDIKVSAQGSDYPYKLADMMCTAAWSSAVGYLPCPGKQDSPDGSIILLTRPKLETGKLEDEPTLWMRSQRVVNGWITGVFPSVDIQSGDYFLSEVGCLYNNPGCDVTFTLGYRVEAGAITNLDSYREVYDGNVTRVEFDLSGLEDQAVRLVLGMSNNGEPAQADGYWLVPSIRQVQSTPTVTPIPTNDPTSAVLAARQAVAQDAGVPVNQVSVISAVERVWSDTCLELPKPSEICLPAIIAGYRIFLRAGTQNYEAHTDQDGSQVRFIKI